MGLSTDRLKIGTLDAPGTSLTPEEMFVASRLMGADLKASELLSTCGLPRPQAIELVAKLLQKGLVRNLDQPARAAEALPPPAEPPGPPRTVSPPAPAAAAVPREAPKMASPVDPAALDLTAERQHELLALEQQARAADPRAVLGLPKTATLDEVKAAYFELSRRLHPDQFFRKRLGSFQGKVDQIFTRVTQAFQELTRPPAVGPPAPGGAVTAAMAPPAAELPELADALPALETDLELPETGALASESPAADPEITGRPRERFQKALARHKWAAAAEALAALALEDPNALDVPKLRAELGRREGEAEAKLAFEKGNAAAQKPDWAEAFKLYERASTLDPRNPVYVERAARALMYDGDLKEAKRLAERAIELKADDPLSHLTLANVFLRAGMERNARREFELALKLDPKNDFAKSQLRKGWWKG